MEFLLVLFILFIVGIGMWSKPTPTKSNITTYIVKERFCPPHKWSWVPMIDKDGVQHGERMVCKICGPLRNGEE